MGSLSRALKFHPYLRNFTSAKLTWSRRVPEINGFLRPSLLSTQHVCLSHHPKSANFHTEVPSPKPPTKFFTKEIKIAFGLGLALASYFIYDDYKKTFRSNTNKQTGEDLSGDSLFLKERPPEHTLARSINNPKDTSGLKLTLYQYQTCPFCCKLRAFLDYYGFSYDVVEVNSVTRAQTKWTSYRKVPFLIVEIAGSEYGDSTIMQLKDSSLIISALASSLRSPKESLLNIVRSYPEMIDEETQKLAFANRFFVMYGDDNAQPIKHAEVVAMERNWRRWVDDVFVHTLSPNVYRTPSESLQAFRWFSEVGDWERLFATWERLLVVYVGAAAMWIIGKRLKKRYKLEDDPRVSLYAEANAWMEAVALTEGPFLGGDQPDLADISMYGVLTAIEGCDAFQDMLNNSNIGRWFYEMKTRVGKRKGEQALVAKCSIR